MANPMEKNVTLRFTNHRQLLCDEMCQFFDDQLMVDMDISCHGIHSKVHKLVLAIFCPALRGTLMSLANDEKENIGSSLKSLDLGYVTGHPKDVEYLIEFIYRGKVVVPRGRLKALLETANSLGMKGLISAIGKLKIQLDDATCGAPNEKIPIGRRRKKGRQQKSKHFTDEAVTNGCAIEEKRDICDSGKEYELSPKISSESLQGPNGVVNETEDTNCNGDFPRSSCRSDESDIEDKCKESHGASDVQNDAEILQDEKSPRSDVESVPVRSAGNGKWKRTSYARNGKSKADGLSKTESRKLWRLTRPVMKCPHCEYETRDKGSYKSHIAKHDPSADRFVCDVCAKTFRSKRGFRCHTRSHYDPEHLHKCAYCEFQTPQKWSWLQHLAVIHKMDPQGNPLSENIKCAECNKSFVAEHQLKAHMVRKHTLDKPYKCQQCPYSAVIRYELDKHISIKHKKERRFMCELCSFRSQTQSGFERHKRSHTGVKPFTCSICCKLYADNRKLKTHMLRHVNDEKSWVCHLCGHACRRKDNLQMHLKRIHHTTMDCVQVLETPPKVQTADSILQMLLNTSTASDEVVCSSDSPAEIMYSLVEANSEAIPQFVYEEHQGLNLD